MLNGEMTQNTTRGKDRMEWNGEMAEFEALRQKGRGPLRARPKEDSGSVIKNWVTGERRKRGWEGLESSWNVPSGPNSASAVETGNQTG